MSALAEVTVDEEREVMNILSRLGVVVQGIADDSRRVRPGDVFLAFPGEAADGRAFIAQAVAAGAAGVLWEPVGWHWNPAWRVPQVAVPGLRQRAGEFAAEVCGHPSKQLVVVGVTGTNGKTSVSQWVAAALTRLGRKSAVVGTLGNGFPGALGEAKNTTPGAVELHKLLAAFRDDGARACAIEVSSHALDQGRVSGVHFAVAALTNLSRDHLDYHGDMARYAAAKARLFDWPDLGAAVVNADDGFGVERLCALLGRGVRGVGYGIAAGDVRARDLVASALGLRFTAVTPWGEAGVESSLLGRFNAANLLCALAILLMLDVALADAVAALSRAEPPAGRMQRLGGGHQPLVVVDYAHTPDALEQVLVTLRELGPRRLVCVFGCGGNRDKGKRPLMGAAAVRLADRVILTSDNPRHEDPEAVIADILAGATGDQVRVEPDRGAAIAEAIAESAAGDIVLVAGKGHETYQEIGALRLPFSDAAIAAKILGLSA